MDDTDSSVLSGIGARLDEAGSAEGSSHPLRCEPVHNAGARKRVYVGVPQPRRERGESRSTCTNIRGFEAQTHSGRFWKGIRARWPWMATRHTIL